MQLSLHATLPTNNFQIQLQQSNKFYRQASDRQTWFHSRRALALHMDWRLIANELYCRCLWGDRCHISQCQSPTSAIRDNGINFTADTNCLRLLGRFLEHDQLIPSDETRLSISACKRCNLDWGNLENGYQNWFICLSFSSIGVGSSSRQNITDPTINIQN